MRWSRQPDRFPFAAWFFCRSFCFLPAAAQLFVRRHSHIYEDARNNFGISWCRVADAGFFHRLRRSGFASFGWCFDFSSPDLYALRSVCVHFEFFHLEEQTLEAMMSPNEITALDAAMTLPFHSERDRRGASEFRCSATREHLPKGTVK